MCITNVYVDRYPDGREVEFRQTSLCSYGLPNMPCPKTTVFNKPVRHIQFHEPTSQYILSQKSSQQQSRPTLHPVYPPYQSNHTAPMTPPRSPAMSSEGSPRRDKKSKYEKQDRLKPTRQHKKERIVIVDPPMTPRTPPMRYAETFNAPSTPPRTPPVIIDTRKPVIVDERRRADSRRRSLSVERGRWESPSTSHTSFDLRAERERQRDLERMMERDRLDRELERESRERRRREARDARERDERMRLLDDEIRRRPAFPMAPRRPIVEQDARAVAGARRWEEEAAEEAMKQRLRERQMPRRRVSMGPGAERRYGERVLYVDGVYH
jgi:hypothetical protein